MNEKRVGYPLDEFASFALKEDKAKGQFVITIRGDAKYRHMIADKIGELAFTDEDMKKWEVR
jgi:hypothetical protein